MIRRLIILIFIVLYGCSPDEEVWNKEIANSTFEPFFKIFKEEARKRGYNFDNHEILFYFGDFNHASAFANYDKNEIVFDRESWSFFTHEQREAIVFHELGHSILKRGHSIRKTESGECLSYMRKNSEICYRNLHSELWREYFLDELFNRETPLPHWYLGNKDYDIRYPNKKEITSESNNIEGFFSHELDTETISNLVIEVTFKNWRPENENFSNTLMQSVKLNDLYFISQPRSNVFEIGNYVTGVYFRDIDYNFEDQVKFTIRRNQNINQFFINEKLVHITDNNVSDINSLKIEYESGLDMDIELFTYE